MKKRVEITVLFLLLSTFSFSQTKWKVWYPTPIVGYIWQKTHSLELGTAFNLTNTGGNRHMMISVPIGLDLNWYQKRNYVSPFISMKYYYSFSKQLHGIDISLIYWRSRINGSIDQRLTPEIGFVLFGYARIAYGYNIPIGKNELDYFGRHRIALRIPGI